MFLGHDSILNGEMRAHERPKLCDRMHPIAFTSPNVNGLI